MNQPFDVSTIVFAALAVFVVWKLRSVLGTRTGQERPPFNPFARRGATDDKGQPRPDGSNVIPLPGSAAPQATAPRTDPDRWKGIAEPGSALAAGLDSVAAADASFAAKSFLDGARAAYEMIIAAFAKGDRSTLKNLLAPDVYDGFASAIAEREGRKETASHTFVAMDKAVIEEASMRGSSAQIAVRFESQQSNAVRTEAGTPAEGSDEAVGTVIDHWTFARDVASRDPNWKLVATNAE